MNANELARAVSLLVVIPIALAAQLARYHDPVALQNWAAPLYWQPAPAEREAAGAPVAATTANLPLGTNALVFVAMTPCRIADTRAGQGFSGAFGPPSLVGGATGRTFPIRSNTTCPVPSVAQAYSFNLSVVPPASGGFITAYPTPGPLPLAATLIWAQALLVSNAAVVPAGTNGSVDVYASANTDLVIDVNGYYAAPSDLAANTALGAGALANNTTGQFNTANGDTALNANTTGNFNTATGVDALAGNTAGSSNTATGASALQNNSIGQDNTADGFSALNSNTTGSANTASGMFALRSNTVGTLNTASGYSALLTNASGNFNTAAGVYALQYNTSGSYNTAGGGAALQDNTTGNFNTATGHAALEGNTTGFGNTAEGDSALGANVAGSNNTAIGSSAMAANGAGSNNTAIGGAALALNQTGTNNIAIGYQSASNVSAGNNNNIHIGSQGAATDSGTIRIGSPGTQASFFAAGVRGVATGSNDAVGVVIDSNGQLGTVNSSRRFKEDIQDMGETSSGLLRLRPVTFRYKHPFADGSQPVEYGLIAEEVAEVYPDLIARSADGQIESVKYQVLDSMLLNELQKEHRQVQQQTEEIRQLQTRLAAVERLLSGGVPPAAPAGR